MRQALEQQKPWASFSVTIGGNLVGSGDAQKAKVAPVRLLVCGGDDPARLRHHVVVTSDPLDPGGPHLHRSPYGPDDPIFRGNRQVDGDQKRIPSSVHTKLDDMPREFRRSGIRYGRSTAARNAAY